MQVWDGVIHEFKFRPEAGEDLIESVNWYEDQQPGLGAEFNAAFELTLSRIDRNAEVYRRSSGKIRKARMVGFPFSIYYLIENQRIEILAVWHGARDIGLLEKRVRARVR